MKLGLKRIFFSALWILLTLIFSLWLLSQWITADSLKPQLTELIRQRTGYLLTINGPLKWSCFPTLKLSTAALTLQSPNTTEKPIHAQDASLTLHWLSMLSNNRFSNIHWAISNIDGFHLNASNLSGEASIQQTGAQIGLSQATVYQGKLNGKLQITSLNATPKYEWQFTLSHAASLPLLKALTPNAHLTLNGDLSLEQTGQTIGTTQDALFKALQTTTRYQLTQGTLQGINLDRLTELKDRLLNSNSPTTLSLEGNTHFDELTGTVQFANLTASTHDSFLKARNFSMKTTGNYHFISDAIQLQLSVQSTQHADIPPIPLQITGTLSSPEITLNIQKEQQQEIKDTINKAKERAKSLIDKHFHGDTNALLQKILR